MRKLARTILALSLFLFAPILFAEPLDINTATPEQLAEAMVGVGKVKAQAIVQDREKNGKFKSVDDLGRVKGIGPAIIEKNRSKITVGMETPAAASAQTMAGHPATPPASVQAAQPGSPVQPASPVAPANPK